VVIGLLPAVMFVTGAIMWWNRVLRRWLAQARPRVYPERAQRVEGFPAEPAAE
jgi:uncharacterized iron-regulated membrane protein